MYNNSFFKKILIVACVVLLYSCDKDFNSVGDGLIGDNNFDFAKYTSSVLAYNQKIDPIQSDNLSINSLGILVNPAFGTTTANFATQLSLNSANPVIGKNPVIESVILTIPYFSTLISTDSNGDHLYRLDSIYGNSGAEINDARIKLSVYESGFFMRDLDPSAAFQQAQKYFTDQNGDFDSAKVGTPLNNDYDKPFLFSAAEYKETVTTDGKDVVTRTAPGMRLTLNSGYFKTKIIDGVASAKLSSNEVFKEYFRGLYFKVEKSDNSPSALAQLDFKKGKITIKYKEDSATDDTRVEKSIILNLNGNTVSLLTQSDSKAAYASATEEANINRTLGDERLYLKGGQGSMSILELFGPDADNNGVADELETIRKSGWLINEANLVFHVDASAMGSAYEPKRIYLYDLKNNRPVFDYVVDGTAGTDAKNGKTVFGGILNKENAADGIYKIRITNQIRNLIKNADSTNVKLGVVVTEDINTTASYKLRKANSVISQAPKASVMSPLGTIIYGSKATVPEDKRLKLEIYYTKPN